MPTEPLIIALSGEYDMSRQRELDRKLRPALDTANVVIDLSAVTYMDSSCLNTFSRLRRERRGEHLPLCRFVITNSMVRKVFGITGFDHLWPIHGSVDDALAESVSLR